MMLTEKKSTFRRIIAMLLTAAMVLGGLPSGNGGGYARAEGGEASTWTDLGPVDEPVLGAAPAMLLGAAQNGDAEDGEEEAESLQKMIDDSIAAKEKELGETAEEGESLNKWIYVFVKKSTVFTDEQVEVKKEDGQQFEGITIETDDAGEDGLSADGTTKLTGSFLANGVKVKIKGLVLAGQVTVQNGAELDYSGTAADDTLNVAVADKESSAAIATGEGNDAVTVRDQGGLLAIDTGAGDDTVTVAQESTDIAEAPEGEALVTVSTGDGDDTVTAGNAYGSMSISTGDGNDTVTAVADGGDMKVRTGTGNDTVNATLNQYAASFDLDTGDGKDSVKLTDKAVGGLVTIVTGGDDDTLEMDVWTVGQGITADLAEGDDSVTVIGSGASAAAAGVSIMIKLGTGINDATVNTSVGNVVPTVEIDGTEGNDHLHITGTLESSVAEDDRAKGTAEDITLAVSAENSLNIKTSDIESITDDLENKKTVKLTPVSTGANAGKIDFKDAKSFVNYVVNAPSSTLKDVLVTTADGTSTILSNVVIDTDVTSNEDHALVINKGTTVKAPGMKLVLRARNIEVNGELQAEVVQLEALDGTGMYARNFKDQYNLHKEHENAVFAGAEAIGDLAWDMVNISDKASVKVGTTGVVKAAGDVIMLAKVEQSGTLISTIPVNAVNVKIGEARVDIDGKVYAGYDFKNGRTGTGHGSVRADAQVKITTGEPEKQGAVGAILENLGAPAPDGYPIGVTVALGDAAVHVSETAEVEAEKDISLSSKSEVKTSTRADSGLFGAPAAVAVSVLVNDASTTVDGKLTAGGDIRAEADAKVEAKTLASKGDKDEGKSDAYVAVSVVLQDSLAKIGEKAVVDAGGKVRVGSRAEEKAENTATSANVKREDSEKTDEGEEAGFIMEDLRATVWPWIKESIKSEPSSKEKLDGAMKKLAGGDHAVELDDEAQKNGEVTVTPNNNESTVTYGVKVNPWTGYKVKSVTARGYNPGSNAFLICDISHTTGNNYIVTPKNGDQAVQNVIVFVEYEEDGEYEEPTAADLFDEKKEEESDDTVDLQKLLDDVSDSTDDADSELDRALKDLEEAELIKLALSDVLTYETENDGKTCLKELMAGDKIRLIPNPPAGEKLKDGGLTATYKVKEKNDKDEEKLVEKTTVISADGKGRYYFTVPENVDAESGIQIKADHEAAGTSDKKADKAQNEAVGAFAVIVADNDSTAVIEKNASVTAGKNVEVASVTVTNIINKADGSPAGEAESSGSSSESKKAEGEAIKREETENKTVAQDKAKYGLVLDSTVNGTVAAAKAAQGESYSYAFTVTPATGYEVASVLVTYVSGGEKKTEELKAGTDGKYTADLDKGLSVDAGTTVHINASFAKEGVYTEILSTGAEQIVLKRPVKVTYNKGKGDDGADMGSIAYSGTSDDGTKYIFTATPKETYVLDVQKKDKEEIGLKATWTDADGKTQTRNLTKSGDNWELDLTGIPETATIEVSGTFKNDLRTIQTGEKIENGSVTLYDKEVKKGDKPVFTVKPDANYSLKDITVTYKSGDKEKTIKLSDSNSRIKKVNGKETLYQVELADALAEDAKVTVTASFEKKTIGLFAGKNDADKGKYNISEGFVAPKDEVKVTPTDSDAKAGKKVKSVKVMDGDKEVASSTSGSFKVPENTAANSTLTLLVEMEDKEVAMEAAKLENGSVTPASARADRDETVTVTVKPAKDFKVKQGTLKAVIKANDGSFTKEVVLSRQNDTTYTFLMPHFTDVSPDKVSVTFIGEFEPGLSDSGTMDTSIGAAIAVTVANSESNAQIKGVVKAGGDVKAESSASGGMETTTKAGYSKGNTGIGGAVSVQVASMDSKALIYQSADVQLDGALALDSKADATFNVQADASGGKEAKKTGVGAGIAVAVNGSDAFAAVQDNTKLAKKSAAAEGIKGISITANQKITDTVSAKAGAAGGTAAVPVAAVDVTAATAKAYMGKVTEDKLVMTGDAAVSAAISAEHTVTADASATGKGVGVGAAIVVSVLPDKATASLNQSVEADKVTVAAETVSKVSDTATAGASGGKKEEEKDKKKEDAEGGPDKQADKLLGGAGKLAGKNKSSGVSGGMIDNAAKDRQKSETSEGTVGVAGALVVNVQFSKSIAEVMKGVNLKAKDLVSVTALNGTTSLAKANASTTNSDVGVGVGIAVNIVFLDNIAKAGDGTIEAAILKVAATTKMKEPDAKKEEANKEEKADTKDELVKQLGEKAGQFINNVVREIGLDQYISGTLLGEIVNPVVTETISEMIKVSGIGDLFEGANLTEKYQNAKQALIDAKDGLMAMPELLMQPMMDVLGSLSDDVDGLTPIQIDEVLDFFKENLADMLKTAGEEILTETRDGLVEYLKGNVGDILSGVVSEIFTEEGSGIFEEAKKIISTSVKSKAKALFTEAFSRAVIQSGIMQNVEHVKSAIDTVKDVYQKATMDDIFSQACGFVTDTFKENVFDYEEMLDKISKTDFKKLIIDTLKSGAKKASVTLTNEVINALSDHFELGLAPEEEKATGHVVNTQAIAGAGARDVGVAGSVAITVLNSETSATIADGGDITVSKDVTVEANENIIVKNTASAAIDAKGNADDNKAAGKKEEKDAAGGNDAKTRADAGHVTMETAPGATVEILSAETVVAKPRVFITVKEGYKLPEKDGKPYAEFTYTDKDGKEVKGTVEVMKEEGGNRWYVNPKTGALAKIADDVDVHLELKPEEILNKITVDDPLTDGDVTAAKSDVTVKVKDRDAEKDDDGKEIIKGRAGETVEIHIKRAEGRELVGVGYTWVDAQGVSHDVELNNSELTKVKDQKEREKGLGLVSSNKDEYVYSFTMPDGEVTSILAGFVKGEDKDAQEPETKAKDENGKGVGVGAAFSMVYGGNTVKAEIGNRVVKAGELAVTASADHSESISASAGTDPLEEEPDDASTKKYSVDASIALNIVDYDIQASVAEGADLTLTEWTEDSEKKGGNLAVKAEENAKTETTGSAYAVGGKTAVGATVAINIADTSVKAEMAGTATVDGGAEISAASHSEDKTRAVATAMGADIARNLKKLNQKTDNMEEKGNKLLDGSYIDDLDKEKEEKKDGDKKDGGEKEEKKGKNDTADRINKRLDEKKTEEGKDTNENNSTSSNAMRAMGTKAKTEDAGSEGTEKAGDTIRDKTGVDLPIASEKTEESSDKESGTEGAGTDGTSGTDSGTEQEGGTDGKIPDLPGKKEKKEDKNWQVAAAIGVTVASHSVNTKVGKITAKGGAISATAENTGNFNTIGAGSAMSMAEHANSIAAGVAVSVNNNKAKVEVNGDQSAAGDLTLASKLTQNLDGEFAGKLAVQSLSGSVAGKDSDVSIGGAISFIYSAAESSVKIADGTADAKRKLEGADITIEATDKSKLASRAGGLSLSKGSSVGMGIASSNVISKNTITAEVGSNAEITGTSFTLKAEKQAVEWEDYNGKLNMRRIVSDSSKLSDDERKNADTGLIDLHKGNDDESYKLNINLSTDKLLDAADALNVLSGQNTYVEAIAGSVMTGTKKSEDDGDDENASKLSLAGSFAVAVTNNTIGAKLGKNAVVTLTAAGDKTGAMTVNAENKATSRIIAGSMSAAPAKASVGVTAAVLITDDEVNAETGEGSTVTADGDVTQSAKTEADIQVFTAAMAVAAGDKISAAAGGAVNVIISRNKSVNTVGDGANITSKNAGVNFTSNTKQDLMAISGSANVTAGKAKGENDSTYAAGGTINVIYDNSQALNNIGAVTVTAAKDVNMASDVTDQLISGTASVSAAASKGGKAGAGVINFLWSESAAKTDIGKATITATEGDVNAAANNDAWMLNATLSVAAAAKDALGAGFNVNIFQREASVDIAGGTMTAGRDLKVQSSGRDTSIMAGLGASGAAKGSALSGTVVLLVESNNISTKAADTGVTATAGRNAALESYFSDFTVGAAGNIAISAKDASYGVTSVTAIKNNTVATELGASKITANNKTTEKTETLTGRKNDQDQKMINGVHIGAEAQETQFFAGAGVAASKGTSLNGEAVVLVNNNTVTADASAATLEAKEGTYANVGVFAADTTKQTLLAGGLNLSVSGSAVGAAVSTIVSNKAVTAKGHDMHAAKDVSVTADNLDDISTLAVSVGGAKGTAVEIGVAVQVLKSRVNAIVGSQVTAENGDFNLSSANNTKLLNVAGAIAGSVDAPAVAPVGAITYFQGESNAVLKDGSTAESKKGNINITTESIKDVKLITAGISASSGFGLSGAANILVSKDKAKAEAGTGTTLTAGAGSLNINAESDYKLRAISGAIGLGKAAVGVNAVVSVLKSNATADLGGNATVGRDLNVNAKGKRDIINVAATVAAGSFSGGITVMVLAAGTKMSQDAADMIAYGNADKHDDKNKGGFDAELFMSSAEASGVDFNTINQDEASKDRQLSGKILAADLEGNGHSESTETVGKSDGKQSTFDGASKLRSDEIDTQANDTDDEDNRGENMKADDTADVKAAKEMNTYTYDADPSDAIIARIRQGVTVSADKVNVIATEQAAADLIGAGVAVGQVGAGVSTVVAILHSNVSASSMANITKAAGGVTVKAESKAGKLDDDHDSGDRDAAVADLLSNKPTSAEKENPSDEDKEKAAAEKEQAQKDKQSTMAELKDKLSARSIRAFSVAAGAGQVGLAVAVSVVLTDNVTQAILGGKVENAGPVNVAANHDYGTVMAATGSLALGGIAAVGASVSVAQANGTVKAEIADDATVTTTKGSDINVATTSKVGVDSLAVTAGGGGYAAVNAGLALSFNRLNQITGIGSGTTIDSGKDINVSATSNTSGNNYLLGVSVGGVAVALNAAVSNVEANIDTHIGKAAKASTITAANDITMKNDTTSSASPKVATAAAGGVAVGGNVLLAFNQTTAKAYVDNATVKANNLSVTGDLAGEAVSSLAALQVGAIAVGVSVNYADMRADNRAAVYNSDLDLAGDLKIMTGEGKNNKTNAEAHTISGSAGAVSVGINTAIAWNNTRNYAVLDTAKNVKVDGSLLVHGKGDTNAEATIKGFDLGAAVVALSAVVALNDADTRTEVKTDGTLTVGGDAEFDVTQSGTTNAKMLTGGGSIVALRVSAAVAYGRTGGLDQVEMNGVTTIGGNLIALNKSGNNVTSQIDNMSFDAISAAARFTAAYTQDTYQTKITNAGRTTTIEKDADIQTIYTANSTSKVKPSIGGVNVSLADLAINGSIAKNTAYAGTSYESIIGLNTIKGNLTVKTTGTVKSDATVETAELSVGGISLGANIAKADMSVQQAAFLRVGRVLNVKNGTVDVQSVANSATANATIGSTGSKMKLDLKLANMDVSYAVARENMSSTAAVLGGPIDQVEVIDYQDNGRYVTETVGRYDYDFLEDGVYVVRDKDGNVLHETVTMIFYDTDEYEIINAEGQPVVSTLVEEYDGIREEVEREETDYEMMRIGEHFRWITEEQTRWVEKLEPYKRKENVYNADENKLNAATLNVYSGTADGTKTGAYATTITAASASLFTAGALDSKAYSGDYFSVVFEGTKATITGKATLKAETDTVADSLGATPGGLTVANAATSDVTAQVGRRDDKQTVSVIIGRGNSLTAGSIEIIANNVGKAKAKMDQGTSFSVGTVKKSTQPTESFYNTLISIGREAKLNATAGDITITGSDAPTADSTVETENYSLTMNLSSMMGKNTIDQNSNIDVGIDAEVTATGKIHIRNAQRTIATAQTTITGGSVIDSNTAKAQNIINRVARINIGEGATVTGSSLLLESISGENDNIYTKSYVSGKGLAAMGNARSYADINTYAEINVREGATLTAPGKITLDARTTSYNSKNTDHQGIRTYATVDNGGVVPLPNTVAKNTLLFKSFININRRPDEELKSTTRKRVSIISDTDDVLVNASNESLSVYAETFSKGAGAAGVSNADSWNAMTLTNAVYIDDTTLDAKNIRVYADNGGTLKDGDESKKVRIKAKAFAQLMAAGGKVQPEARVTGVMINQLRSNSVNSVTFNAASQEIHKTSSPENSVIQSADADYKRVEILGLSTTKANDRSELVWYVHNRCDFCDEGEQYDVRGTEQETLDERYDDAFAKALSPISEIQRQVNTLGSITKARYGEEDDATAGKLFVLDVESMLEKAVTLSPEDVRRYRLWMNRQTFMGVYLLPNAARLYTTNSTGRLQYAVDTLKGDLFGTGRPMDIDILTALTKNAFNNPVIPVGSTGSLDLNTGLLTLPDRADYELYLDEISGAWLLDGMENGFIRTLVADPEEINACALEGADLPQGTIVETILMEIKLDGTEPEAGAEGEEAEAIPENIKVFWVGTTPGTADDPDRPLIFLSYDTETDEIDAFRTSAAMLEAGEDAVDVSLYMYRDSKYDRMGVEKYNVMFFDTPKGEDSLVKAVTNVLAGRELELPMSLKIVLRGRYMEGADKPVYTLADNAFVLCDGTDGAVDVQGKYTASFDGDVFESNYTRIEGIRDGSLSVTIKENQPVWPEWTGENTAADIGGTEYRREDRDSEWEQVPDDVTMQAKGEV